MDGTDALLLVVLLSILLVSILLAVYCYKPKIFTYPYFQHKFDVSGRRVAEIEKLIDQYINNGGFNEIQAHENQINQWKSKCKAYLGQYSGILLEQREKQYKRILDDSNAYRFKVIRNQTRYKQVNYQRYPYVVENVVGDYAVSFNYLANRNRMLSSINYESTIADYNSKQQRKLLTKDLRRQIMERDDYTCQYCGKYMPDEIGLHIDHIIPIAKGGKTVASNLQVLCSKCNGYKSNKTTI